MKKAIIILMSLIGLVLLTAVLLPVIFKDDIQAAIDSELDKNLNAQVYYDTDAFSLSVFKSFPNLTLTIGDFGIVGKQAFEKDTLLSVGEFSITLDIMSVIGGEQINIVNVSLLEPDIKVLVLADGSANYDIAVASEEIPEEEEAPAAPLNIQIQGWEIVNTNLEYDDQTLPMAVSMKGLNHSGSGDFATDIFDMITTTSVDGFSVNYDGVEYISNKKLTADLTMAMDFTSMKFTFKENRMALNNFAFGFDGFVSMPGDDIDMEINYGGKDIDLLSMLSLIPGVYQEYMDGVTANGNVGFDGYVKGTYNETSMPQVAANFSIAKGQIKYAEYPVPMEEIEVSAKFEYPSADLRETSFLMDKFHMKLDGEEVSAYLFFKDLEDYYWDFRMDGNLDLEKITQVVKLEGMSLKGKLNAELNTKGRMSDLDAERYELLPTTGSAELTGFTYESPDLPQGFGIASTKLTLDPAAIKLISFKGNAGKTDLNMEGEITNYLQYVMADSAMLFGTLNFSSSYVDANEWMASETEDEVEDTTAMEVVRIPENIDFVLTSKIEKILYDDLEMKSFGGKVIVRDGAVRFQDAGFNMLDGTFGLDGSYESKAALEKPLYDFDFSIKELSISSAFQSFVTIQKLVPIAEKMTGRFSTDFKINGAFGSDMMPIYEEMQGAGLVEIAKASVKDVKVLSAISNVSKLNQSDGEVTLADVLLSTEIKNGRLYVEPFDLKMAGRKATVGGSTGIDGSLDYVMAMDVPSGQVGNALNSALSSLSGFDNAIGKDITLNLGIQGNYDSPKVKLLSANPTGSASGGVKAALKDQAKAKLDEKKAEVTAKVDAAKDSVKAEIDARAKFVKDSLDAAAEKAKEKAEEEVKDKATDAVKDLFGKKKKSGGK